MATLKQSPEHLLACLDEHYDALGEKCQQALNEQEEVGNATHSPKQWVLLHKGYE